MILFPFSFFGCKSLEILHHAARRLLECNIVNIECKKCGKSTFWMFLVVTSLTRIYRFLWECVSKMLATSNRYVETVVFTLYMAGMVMAVKIV